MAPLVEQIERAARAALRRRRRSQVLAVLCLFVGVGTLYALARPAVTASFPPVCGVEEHVHTEDCYRWELVEDEEVLPEILPEVLPEALPEVLPETIPEEIPPVSAEPEEVPTETPEPPAEDHSTEDGPLTDIPEESAPEAPAPEEAAPETESGGNEEDAGDTDVQAPQPEAEPDPQPEAEPEMEDEAPEPETESDGGGVIESLLSLFSAGPEERDEESREEAPEGWHWEEILTCGLEEHTHGADCYVEEGEAWVATRVENEDSLAGIMSLDLFSETDESDLAQYITGVQLTVNGSQVTDSAIEVPDGAELRVHLNYQIPANQVTTDNYVFTYQLPLGMKVEAASSGPVFNSAAGASDTIVGSYTIDENGLVTITFNEEFAASQGAVTGALWVGGTASYDATNGSGQFEFVGETNRVVVTIKQDSSLTVEKTSPSQEGATVKYEVTVTGGANCTQPITIQDTINYPGNSAFTYDADSFHLYKIDAENPEPGVELSIQPTIETTGGWQSQFTYTGLSALGEGEQYKVVYTGTLSDEAYNSLNGYVGVGNSAQAWEENKYPESDSLNVSIRRQLLTKSGQWNQSANRIDWTILINETGEDISGWVLRDTLQVVNGETIETIALPETVYISPAVTANGTDPEAISFVDGAFTFPDGSNKTYTITYSTEAEENSGTYKNSATLEDEEGNRHPVSPEVGTTYIPPLDIPFEKTKQDGSGEEARFTLTVEVPETGLPGQLADGTSQAWIVDTAGNNLYFTADTVAPFSVYWTPVDGERQLLTLDEDYELVFALYEEGNQHYSLSDLINDPSLQLRWFRIDFIKEVRQGTLSIEYGAYADLDGLEPGHTRYFNNTAQLHVGQQQTSSDVTWSETIQQELLMKQGAETPDGTYTSSPLQVTYDQDGTYLHYRLIVNAFDLQGELTIQDRLPQGTTLEAGSFKVQRAVGTLDNIWNSEAITNAVAEVGDGNLMTVTIPTGYEQRYTNEPLYLLVYYSVRIDDPFWSTTGADEKDYRNDASLQVGDETYEAHHDQTVRQPVLTKDGWQEQIVNEETGASTYTGTVTYRVVINPGGVDLVSGDELTLTDVLTYTGRVSRLTLEQSSVQIWYYDASQPEGKGPLMDPMLYKYQYDESTQTTVFTVRDATPMVLEYQYSYMPDGTSNETVAFSNSASLTGMEAVSNRLELDNAWSGAVAGRGALTFYKVDEDRFALTLPEAQFELAYSEDGYNWSGQRTLITDASGCISFSAESEGLVFDRLVLYRLVETKAPAGYQLDSTPHYFVWAPETYTSESQVRNEMQTVLAAAGASESVSIYLIGDNTAYITNRYTELSVRKLWQNADGEAITPPAGTIVELELYRQEMALSGHAVTVRLKGPQSGQQATLLENVYYVEDGSDLTLTTTGDWGSVTWTWTQTNEAGERLSGGTIIQTDSSWQQTIKNIQGNCTLEFVTESYVTPDVQATYSEATFVPSGTPEYVETVTLSAENEWRHSWSNMPTEVDGKPVYYSVKEGSLPPGYTVSYSNNLIQTGQIVVVNTRSAVVLPETGGTGTNPYTWGGLALLLAASALYKQQAYRKREETSQ